MYKRLGKTIAVLFIATATLAKDGLIVSAKVNPQVHEQAWRIYIAACTTVEREFSATRLLRPRIVLVLGAEKDSLNWEQGKIRLRAWDPYLFTQGVMALAYRQLMPWHVSLDAKRALGEVMPRTAERLVIEWAPRSSSPRSSNW